MAKNQYQSALDDAVKAVEQQYQAWKKVDEQILSISKNAREAYGKAIPETPRGVSEHLNKNKVLNEQINAAYKEQQRLEKALISQIAKKDAVLESTNKSLVKQRYETQQLNKQNKESAVLTSKLSTFYQKQSVILNKLTRERQDLLLKQKLGHTLSVEEEKDLQRLTKAQIRLDKALKETDESNGRNFRSVGKYQNALKGLKGVVVGFVGAFGVVEGLRLAFDFTKEAVALAKEAKGIEFAFKDIGIEGERAFLRIKKSTRGLISDIDIKRSLNEFQNFNISLEQTDTLFEFLAIRATQTGRSIDSLKDSLVEGLSKESKLRIDNLGISASELNAELERTPNFVEAVANIAQTEIAKAGDILDEASNSTEKWTASIENLKLSIGTLFTSDDSGFSRLLQRAFQGMSDGVDNFSFVVSESTSISDKLKFGLNNLTKGLSLLNPNAEKATGLFYDFTEELKSSTEAAKLSRMEIEEHNKAFVAMNGSLAPLLKSQQTYNNFIFQRNDAEKETATIAKSVKQYREEIQKLNENIENSSSRSYIADKQKEIDVINAKIKALLGETDTIEKQRDKVVSVFAHLKEGAEETKKSLGNAFVQGVISLEQYNNALNQIDESWLSLERSVEDFDLAEITVGEIQEVEDKVYELQETINKLSWEDQLASTTEFFGAVTGLFNAFIERKVQGYEDDINRNNLYYSQLLDNEKLTERQRFALEAERDAKTQALEKKKREEQRKQAIIEKAFNVASIIANTAVAVSKALAQGGAIFGIPQSALVASLGAIQLATVIAQPIPQFKDGHLEGSYEGQALINDAKSATYREIVQRKDGSLEMYSGRNTVIDMQKGDKVHSAGTFTVDDAIRNMLATTFTHQAQQIDRTQARQASNIDERIEKAIKKGFSGVVMKNSNTFDTRQLAKEIAMNKRSKI